MSAKAKARVYGPFEMANRIASEGVPFLTLPFAAVSNSQILVSISDNRLDAFGVPDIEPDFSYNILHVEVSAWGSVQGYETMIKRQAVTSNWGPMNLLLGPEDAYDQFFLKARIFLGGKPGIPSNMVFARPLSIKGNVHVQPREGLG